MKRVYTILFISIATFNAVAQDITGEWNGLLKFNGMQLRIVFNITKNGTGYSATMDSPDQGAKGIPVTKSSFIDSVLQLAVSNANINYNGRLNTANIIVGNFRQSGQSFPMNLSREKIVKQTVARPQEPKPPYPYYTEDIKFKNIKDKIILAGTLTLPKKDGIFPAVVLITGSGPQNRDEEILGHKPFLVLADQLTRNGVAVLRFDDRGVAGSTGDFKSATTPDFATDVESAIEYLQTRKEINKQEIGLIGHSEGGMIAPLIAARSGVINFIVLLAGPGIPGEQILLLQQELIGMATGVSEAELQKAKTINKGAFDIVSKSGDTIKMRTDLTSYLKQVLKENPGSAKPAGMNDDDFVRLQANQLMSPWMQYFIKYDPAPVLEKVKCPVLALNGEKDLQVPAAINLAAIKQALEKGSNKNVTVKQLPGLNHLFQECTTGAPGEYATIDQTFSPKALDEITMWILNQVKLKR